MLTPILIAIAVMVLAFVVFVATRPAGFRVIRSATMAAPAAKVFAQVNDFHQWAAWSPWEKLDPAMQKTFNGAPSGTGAIYEWNGNKKAGAGRMTITESQPGEVIRIKLEFLKPFQSMNISEFTFQPQGGNTLLTWTMSGFPDCFMFKAMSLLCNMEKRIGGDFERGLAQMKTIVEKA